MPTKLVLCEHYEKTTVAISLRQIHSEYQLIVDEAIKRVLLRWDLGHSESTTLTPQDQFYRRISKIDDIFEGFQVFQEESFICDSPKTIVNNVLAVNNIIVTMLRDCLEVRKRKQDELYSELKDSSTTTGFEFLPWTSVPGPKGIRSFLINQFRLTHEKAIPLAEDFSIKQVFSTQMVDLIDIILDGYNSQINSLASGERRNAVLAMYENHRHDLIMPLVELGFYTEATALAEKYYEFAALIAICNGTKDKERLSRYMDEFSEQNFADFVFAWHVKQGKQGRLLDETTAERQNDLGKFLRGHSSISWLHDMQLSKWNRASETLERLAQCETDYLMRKKTMLSLSKLSVLASDEPDNVIGKKLDELESHLDIVRAQQKLPQSVVEQYGFDEETMRVLTPREIIEMYVDKENINASERDFKRALDMLAHLPPSANLEEVEMHIWVRAILADDWSKLALENPIDSVKVTIFFRLVEICFVEDGGRPLSQILPPIDKILEAEELGELKDNTGFQFLLKAGYEHVFRVAQDLATSHATHESMTAMES